jgi:phosphoadenosine phosphosulfate reductase
MSRSRVNSGAGAADMGGGDSLRSLGDRPKKGAHGGNMVSPVLSAPPLPELDFEAMNAEDILRWAYEEYGEKLCLTCSWQKQSSVLVHMVAELGLDLPVIELDTHLFFRESYETRDRLVERYGLRLLPPPEVITVAEQHRREGPNLWETDPDRCCHIRKVEPLLGALEPYDAWISGIRRDQSPSRAQTPKVQWSERYQVWKLHPLADWDEKRVWAYINVNEIPYNRLHDVGFRSIGCIPCTRPTTPEEEERAGRWAGSDKLECGIHVESPLTTQGGT